MSFWLVIEFSLIVAGIAIVYSPVLTKDFVQEDFVQVAIRHFDAQAAAAQDDWLRARPAGATLRKCAISLPRRAERRCCARA